MRLDGLNSTQIYSDNAKTWIGYFHYGIKVGDIIYDNFEISGMNFVEWQNDLGTWHPGILISYPNEVIPY